MDPTNSDSPPFAASDVSLLLIEHRTALLGYLLACVRNHADAEDLFQEVSLAAIKSAGQLRTRDGFLPWVREIGRRRVLAHFRTTKRLIPTEPALLDRLAESAAELDRTGEVPARIVALRSCLDELPSQTRLLIRLRYEDNRRSVESIANELGRSLHAAYALLKRSRVLLHECVTRKMTRELRS